jgi:hypothetical protein
LSVPPVSQNIVFVVVGAVTLFLNILLALGWLTHKSFAALLNTLA